MNSKATILLTMLLAVFACAQVTAGPPSFTGLGDLDGGTFASEANGVSADGLTVVGTGTAVGREAFRWTAETGMVGLGELFDGGDSVALDVSADGSVIVGNSFQGLGQEAFRWTEAEGMVSLGDFAGGQLFSDARGISADGSVIVGVGSTATGKEAFRWTNSTGLVGLGDLDGGDLASEAFGVSSDGLVVVGTGTAAPGNDATRWTAVDGMVGLGAIPFQTLFANTAYGASFDGSVIVGTAQFASGGIIEGFRWTAADGLVGLGDLFGGNTGTAVSRAVDVSSDGSIIVGDSGMSFFTPEATIWDATHGTRSLQQVLTNDFGLDLTGWNLQRATGVSADGRTIVGYGTNPDGNREAWIAVVPEPSTFVLAGFGLFALIACAAGKKVPSSFRLKLFSR